MNLAQLRQRLFDEIDYNPSGVSPDAVYMFNRFFNTALQRVIRDCPYAFFEQQIELFTDPDVTAEDYFSGDTLEQVTNDPWLLVRTTVLDDEDLKWLEDGKWDGRKIYLTVPSGETFERRIRGIISEAVVGGWQQTVALDRPLPNHLASTDLENIVYRIATTEYYVPDDVVRINGVQVEYTNGTRQLEAIDQETAERRRFTKTPPFASKGVPAYFYRRGHWSIPAPTLAPVLTEGEIWQGPEPLGTFQYCYTYCWGKRWYDGQLMGPTTNTSTPEVRVEPLWESSPSPYTAARKLTAEGTLSARLKFPDYAHELGFNATLRSSNLGWTRRIYRRRLSYEAAEELSTPAIVSTPDSFVLLDEIPVTDVQYDDRGAVIPDITRRLRTVSGYVPFALYPHPDNRYRLRLRVLRRGMDLRDDADVPPIDPAAMDILIRAAEVAWRNKSGNLAAVRNAEASYQREVERMNQTYASMRSAGATFQRGIPRAMPLQFQPWRN